MVLRINDPDGARTKLRFWPSRHVKVIMAAQGKVNQRVAWKPEVNSGNGGLSVGVTVSRVTTEKPMLE